MNIRLAVLNDALLLSSLCTDVQRLHAENHPDIFIMPQKDDFALSFFNERLADPLVRIYIAEEDGHALGYILCKLIEREKNPFTFARRCLDIDQISVRPAARRQGVGKALIDQAEILAQELNVAKIQLASWDFNTGAHALFEKMGFEKFSYRFWRNL